MVTFEALPQVYELRVKTLFEGNSTAVGGNCTGVKISLEGLLLH